MLFQRSQKKEVATAGIVTEKNAGAVFVLLQVTAIFWLLAKTISWKLWIKNRLFPLAPISNWFNWPSWLQAALLVCSISLLIFIIVQPRQNKSLVVLLLLELLSCLADQNRWQPWEYQYIFTLFIFIINRSNSKNIIACIGLMLAATYFYSGLGKLNEGYLQLIWKQLFLRKAFHLSDTATQHFFILYSGYALAIIEMLMAAGLLLKYTQRFSAWLLIVMHLLILLVLGPLGINFNVSVWPWNALMILLLYFIFIQQFASINPVVLWKGWNKIIVIAWLFLPALNYAGYWDNYFSCRLYSGHVPQMALCLTDSTEIAQLKPYISSKDSYNKCDGKALVNIQSWALKELHVPACPELRVYNKIASQWMADHNNSQTTVIFYKLINDKNFETISR